MPANRQVEREVDHKLPRGFFTSNGVHIIGNPQVVWDAPIADLCRCKSHKLNGYNTWLKTSSQEVTGSIIVSSSIATFVLKLLKNLIKWGSQFKK